MSEAASISALASGVIHSSGPGPRPTTATRPLMAAGVSAVEVLPFEFLGVSFNTKNDHPAFVSSRAHGREGDHLPAFRLDHANRERSIIAQFDRISLNG